MSARATPAPRAATYVRRAEVKACHRMTSERLSHLQVEEEGRDMKEVEKERGGGGAGGVLIDLLLNTYISYTLKTFARSKHE